MYSLSIIIPVFNVEQYIEECLHSVISQTFISSVECILVDDCTPDNSIVIAEEIIANYTGVIQFSIIRHRKNKGLSAARNTGIKAAKGKWLFFLDSDDWILPNCFQTMMDTLQKYPTSEIIISSTESENRWVKSESLLERTDIPDYTEDQLWIMKGLLSRPVLFPLSAWNKLYSRDFIVKNHLSFLEGFIREDEIWSFHYSKFVRRVAFNKHNTYHYRLNPNGIVNTNQQYASTAFSLDMISHYLDNITPLGKEIQLRLISRMLIDAYMQLYNNKVFLTKCKSLFLRLLKESPIQRKVGCAIFLYMPHCLLCKRPVYFPTRRLLFGLNK